MRVNRQRRKRQAGCHCISGAVGLAGAPTGSLPAHTRFLVIADPGRTTHRIRWATLRVLAQLSTEDDTPHDRTSPHHSFGRRSRRLPPLFPRSANCSPAFPRVLPDGRASTIFDEFLIAPERAERQNCPPAFCWLQAMCCWSLIPCSSHFNAMASSALAAAAPVEDGLASRRLCA